MIHSSARNSQESVLETPHSTQEPVSQSGSWRPADHYETTPAAGQKKGCPKWVPITCGILGVLGLLVIFGGGYLMMRNAPRLINFYFSTLEREVDKMADADVTPEQKAELRRELARFRGLMRDNASLEAAQPIVMELRTAIGDKRLSSREVESLTERLREASDRLEKKSASPARSGSQ